MTRHEQAIERAREADPKSGGYARRRDNAWPAVVALMEAGLWAAGCESEQAAFDMVYSNKVTPCGKCGGCAILAAYDALADALGVPE